MVEHVIREFQYNQRIVSNQLFYVDSDKGDDTNGIGTRQYPFKTIKRAVEECTPNSASLSISLRTGLDYFIDSDIPLSTKIVRFYKYTEPGDSPLCNPRLINRSWFSTSDMMNYTYGFFGIGLTTISFMNIDIQTADPMSPGRPFKNGQGLIKGIDFSSYQLMFYQCNINLRSSLLSYPENIPSGVIDVSIYNSTINVVNSNSYIVQNTCGRPVIIDVVDRCDINLPNSGSGSILDLVSDIVRDSNNVPRNIICNGVI